MKKEWAIQIFNEDLHLWEFIKPNKKENLLTKEEMIDMLEKWEKKTLKREFRGHNVVNNEAHESDHYT